MSRHQTACATLSTPERRLPGPDGIASGKPFDFVGRITAVVAILPVTHEAARAMLPAGLDLAAQDFVPGDRHPLVLILGRQSDVRPGLLPLGADYLEAILAVPFVQLREHGAQPLCYCPRLLLDRRLPIAIGRLLYRYDKRRALIRMTAHGYRIADPARGELLLDAQFRAAAAPVEPSQSDAAMLFRLPVISRAAHGWRFSFADFGLDRALIEAIELNLTIHWPFVSGLPVGEFDIARIAASRAFRLRTSWRLLGPSARRSLPNLPRASRSLTYHRLVTTHPELVRRETASTGLAPGAAGTDSLGRMDQPSDRLSPSQLTRG